MLLAPLARQRLKAKERSKRHDLKIFADTGVVLFKGEIANIVFTVFDTTVVTNVFHIVFCSQGAGREEPGIFL